MAVFCGGWFSFRLSHGGGGVEILVMAVAIGARAEAVENNFRTHFPIRDLNSKMENFRIACEINKMLLSFFIVENGNEEEQCGPVLDSSGPTKELQLY